MPHSSSDCPLASLIDDLHAMAEAIGQDNIDAAIEIGLLRYVSIEARDDIDPHAVCAECMLHDRTVSDTRDARLRALAARERYRRRDMRLSERARIRAEKRAVAQGSSSTQTVATTAPSLPTAAAAALARAKAKALAKRGGGG